MKKLIFLFLLIIPLFSISQKQGNTWYFGKNAGVDFNSGSPVALTNGQTNYTVCYNYNEGTSVISDSSGFLLFYSDGQNVWNRNQQIMPNGNGLLGNPSSTQSSIIVPRPLNDRYFYIFTTDAFTCGGNLGNGFRYSIIDIYADNKNGDIISSKKNILLLDTVCEKIAVTRHANGIDYWVLTHKFNSDKFYAFLLTLNGITDTVITPIGTIYNGSIWNAQGQLKFSPNGKKIAMASRQGLNILEIFDFDNATGIISNFKPLYTPNGAFNYGVEFSPDITKLYDELWTYNNSFLFQYNLNAGGSNIDSINASVNNIFNINGGIPKGLQIGPDNKIYMVSLTNNKYLSVINNPNAYGTNCNFQDLGIYLAGMDGSYSLPSIIAGYNYSNTIPFCGINIAFSVTNINCNGQCNGTATVTASGGSIPYTYNWNTIPIQTTQTATGLCAGTYTVTVTDASSNTSTASVTITEPPALSVSINANKVTCVGSNNGYATAIVSGGTTGYSYNWSNGQTTQTATGLGAGNYSVTVTDANGCTATGNVQVTVNHLVSVPTNTTPPYNQTICIGNSTVLSVSDSLGAGDTLKWYSGSCGGTLADTGKTITVSPSVTTVYYIRAEDSCNTTSCIAIQVNVIPTTLATPGSIAGNSSVCKGVIENYSVPAVPFATNYSWSFPPGITINNGQGTDSINVTAGGAGQNGNINVTASNSCATSGTATFPIIVHPGTPVKPWDIKGNNSPCAGASEVYSTPDIPGASNYSWSFPTGWAITSGQGNDTVTVQTGAIGNDGDIIVNAGNLCGTSGAYSIAVTVAQCNGLNLKLFLEGLYTGTGSMRATKIYDTTFGFVPKWAANITDTIGVELHDTANYGNLVYTAFGVYLYTDGTAGLSIPANDTGSYYITVKHRNHLKTISANPVSFAGGNANYDFTTNINKAFGDNQKSMSGAAAIYAGDISSNGYNYPGSAFPDGVIDISDVYYVFNSYLNGDYGYLLGDISGDGTVDLTDVYLAFDNYLLGIYAVMP